MSTLAGDNNAFHDFAPFEPFCFSFLLDVEELHFLFGNRFIGEDGFFGEENGFDVIVNAFEAFEALKEFVCFVGIMKMGEIFPFDVEALEI